MRVFNPPIVFQIASFAMFLIAGWPNRATALLSGHVVGVGVVEGSGCMHSVLVTDAGETMSTGRCSPTWESSPWAMGPNLFGGLGSGRVICGVSNNLALAADGGLFEVSPAHEVENVFAASGQASIPGEVFVGIDFRSNPTWTIMGITNFGRLFCRSWVSSSWELILDGPAGPTPAVQPTWGQVKSRFRPGAGATPQDK
jgi:hypothetical protein